MNDRQAASQVRLPANRAFVLQFAVRSPDDGGVFHGRAEHLSSGQVVHFDSLKKLAEFVEQVLGGAQ